MTKATESSALAEGPLDVLVSIETSISAKGLRDATSRKINHNALPTENN